MPTRRLDVWFAGVLPQRRLTVLFRLILLIPQYIVLLFVFIAAAIVTVIGWFAALFMGRLPRWAHTFLTDVLRWLTRVDAYFYLLTDRYPPFSFEDREYPVRPIFPEPGPLNRWTVLFRIFLVLPAAIFSQIVRYGLTAPLIIVTWFIVLIRGRIPLALYGAYSALLRYETRVGTYFYLLTSEYPWGMLGDRVAPVPGPAFLTFPAPGVSSPPPGPMPGEAAPAAPGPTPYGQWPPPLSGPIPSPSPPAPGPAEGEGPGVEGAPATLPPPPPPGWPLSTPPGRSDLASMPPPSPWERTGAPSPETSEPAGWATLVLTGAARGWIIFAIVWGSIVLVGNGAIEGAVARHNSTTVAQYNTIVSDYNDSDAAMVSASHDAQSCTDVPCLRGSHLAAAASLTKMVDDIQGMNLPDNAVGPAHLVESDANQLATIFTNLANSSDIGTYHDNAQRSNLSSILNSYPGDTQNLLNALNSSSPF
jgi:hypothetical protein